MYPRHVTHSNLNVLSVIAPIRLHPIYTKYRRSWPSERSNQHQHGSSEPKHFIQRCPPPRHTPASPDGRGHIRAPRGNSRNRPGLDYMWGVVCGARACGLHPWYLSRTLPPSKRLPKRIGSVSLRCHRCHRCHRQRGKDILPPLLAASLILKPCASLGLLLRPLPVVPSSAKLAGSKVFVTS